MSRNLDVDETLEAYGYGKKSNATVGMVALGLLLLFTAIGAAYMGKMWSDERSEHLQTEQALNRVSQQLSEMETRNSELSSLVADKQSEIERLRETHTQQMAQAEEEHKAQLQRTYAQMNEIVYNGKETLSYIHNIEGRLKKGQKIDRAEAEKLTAVINGLTFLHEQYKKPMAEFRELDRYFKKQLDSIPAASSPQSQAIPTVAVTRPDPAETTNVIGRILNNRKYREDREAYLEEKGRAQGVAQGRAVGINEGKRAALAQAQTVVQQAYSRAQQQMGALSLDKNRYLAQLDQMVKSKNQSANEIDDFFNQSKQILKIHNEIMSVEPTKTTPIRP